MSDKKAWDLIAVELVCIKQKFEAKRDENIKKATGERNYDLTRDWWHKSQQEEKALLYDKTAKLMNELIEQVDGYSVNSESEGRE